MKDIPKSLIKVEPTLSWQAVNVQANNKDIAKAMKEALTVSEKERDYMQEKVLLYILISNRLAYCGLMTITQREY